MKNTKCLCCICITLFIVLMWSVVFISQPVSRTESYNETNCGDNNETPVISKDISDNRKYIQLYNEAKEKQRYHRRSSII